MLAVTVNQLGSGGGGKLSGPLSFQRFSLKAVTYACGMQKEHSASRVFESEACESLPELRFMLLTRNFNVVYHNPFTQRYIEQILSVSPQYNSISSF